MGVAVVLAPSSELGIHGQEGIHFRDMVVARNFLEFPADLSPLLPRNRQDRSELYALLSAFSPEMVSKETHRLTPMSEFGLCLTQGKPKSGQEDFDVVFDRHRLLFGAVDENDKVIGVPCISQCCLMTFVIHWGLLLCLFECTDGLKQGRACRTGGIAPELPPISQERFGDLLIGGIPSLGHILAGLCDIGSE